MPCLTTAVPGPYRNSVFAAITSLFGTGASAPISARNSEKICGPSPLGGAQIASFNRSTEFV